MSSKKKYKETIETWGKVAKRYENRFMDDELYIDTYKRFYDRISNLDGLILEIGCGPGNITRNMLQLNPNLNILATDVSAEMINLAKKNNPKARFKVFDCRKLEALKANYEAIICGFTMPYLSKTDCSKLLFNISNLLIEDGTLYISFVAGNYIDSGYISDSHGNRMYFYFHELEAIHKELESNNLKVIEQVKKYVEYAESTELHIILIVKKY